METVDQRGEDTAVLVLREGAEGAENACELRVLLYEVLSAGAHSVIVDASSVDAIPSATAAALHMANRVCRNRGGQVVVQNPSRVAMKQFEFTDLLLVFRVAGGVSRPG